MKRTTSQLGHHLQTVVEKLSLVKLLQVGFIVLTQLVAGYQISKLSCIYISGIYSQKHTAEV